MATVREKKPGVWEVRVFTGRDAHGKPTQVSRTVHGGKKEAQRVAAALTLRPASTGGRTIADLLQLWFDTNEAGWSLATIRDARSRIKLITGDPFAQMAVARVTTQDVDEWIGSLRKRGVTYGALQNRFTAVRAALGLAVRWGWIQVNPATSTKVPQRKQARREAMTIEDVQRAIDAAGLVEPAAALALRLAAVTGARRGELAALKWTDVVDGRLTIDSAIATERTGTYTDRHEPLLTDTATKTANRRTLSLDEDTLTAIEKLRVEREHLGPWMFGVGERPPNPDRIGYWWREARKQSGIDKMWRLHDLRHWSATMAIANGHDIRTVAGRLGHANAAMTLRVYAHVLEAADQGVAATLGKALTKSD